MTTMKKVWGVYKDSDNSLMWYSHTKTLAKESLDTLDKGYSVRSVLSTKEHWLELKNEYLEDCACASPFYPCNDLENAGFL